MIQGCIVSIPGSRIVLACFFAFAIIDSILLPRCLAVSSRDFVDLSFTCPVYSVCPQICAPTIDECPTDCQTNETLCADGSCIAAGSDCPHILERDDHDHSPCNSPCAPVACAAIIATVPSCFENFASFYTMVENCQSPTENNKQDLMWNNSINVFVCLWGLLGTVAIIAWCWYNQKINPVDASTTGLHLDEKDHRSVSSTQTGYKRTPVGVVLHLVALSIHFGWFALLAVTTSLQYDYVDDDENYVVALKWFCVVWNVGFVWSMALYGPHSIQSLFLRRCSLSEAAHVAVYYGYDSSKHGVDNKLNLNILPPVVRGLFGGIVLIQERIMVLLFANARPDPNKGILRYCKVETNPDGSKYFSFLFRRYNFDTEKQSFVPGSYNLGETFVELAPKGATVIDELELAYLRAVGDDSASFAVATGIRPIGLSKREVLHRRHAVGANNIEMEKPLLLKEFITEISKPFYLYQFYILWIWMTIQYYYMACVNWGIVLVTAIVISWFRYRSERTLYAISHVSGTVTVFRDGKRIKLDHSELVPGDVVELSQGCIHCDMLLLTGEAVVDESALTGEATPQAKVPIDPTNRSKYDPVAHKRQTLFAGTKILEGDNSLAVVVKIASYTTKGQLMREIIAFRTHRLQLYIELPIVVGILSTYSTAFFIYVVFNSSTEPVVAWALGMTAFSNAFPALLPISFTIPVGISFERLARKKVTCSHSDSILIAGSVSKAFFDKTGRSASSWCAGQWMSDELTLAMSTCHSLTLTSKGGIVGNPVDIAMFHASEATLVQESGPYRYTVVELHGGKRVKILRRFEFDHIRMTQSVLVQMPDGHLKAIVKGSGDKLCNICEVPTSYNKTIETFSSLGYYQIAVAWKDVESLDYAIHASRDDIEKDLLFVGVLNFENKLREKTKYVIQELKSSGVDSVMLTGDSILTAIHIAKESNILSNNGFVVIGRLNDRGDAVVWLDEQNGHVVNPLAGPNGEKGQVQIVLTGEAWQALLNQDREYAKQLSVFIRIVARCSPQDKVTVVDTFVGLGFTTLMCGDGGNDCGALKAAHIGVALSDSDASLVAPFTSLDKDIESVLTVLLEGRCALASTFAVYKYIVMYGNISSYCQLITYRLKTSFSDWMWVFTDGVWTVCFSFTLPLASAASGLSSTRPTASILGWQTISSVIGIIAVNYIFMALALGALFHEDWFQCRKWEADIQAGNVLLASDNYETQVTFLMVGYQCLFAAMTFNFGYEFRQAWWRNYCFVAFATAFTFIHVYITLVPGRMSCLWRVNCVDDYVVRGVANPDVVPINNPFHSTVMPLRFRCKLLVIALFNGLATVLYDYCCVNGLRLWRATRKVDEAYSTLVKQRNAVAAPESAV